MKYSPHHWFLLTWETTRFLHSEKVSCDIFKQHIPLFPTSILAQQIILIDNLVVIIPNRNLLYTVWKYFLAKWSWKMQEMLKRRINVQVVPNKFDRTWVENLNSEMKKHVLYETWTQKNWSLAFIVKNYKRRSWRDSLAVRITCCLSKDSGWVPSTHMAAQSHL